MFFMMQGNLKVRAREEIIAKSIEVLCRRGVDPEKITSTMLQSFAVDQETVQKLIKQAKKG